MAQRNPTKSNIGQFGYITEGHIIAKVVDISVQKIPQKHMPKERKIGFQRGGDCLTLFSQYEGIKLLGCVHFNHYPLCQVSFLIAQFVHIHRLVLRLMTWTENLFILWLKNYQALLWWIFQMGKFVWEMATQISVIPFTLDQCPWHLGT